MTNKYLLCAALVCLAWCTGCATINVQKIPPQDGIYPPETLPDAPLVLAIPGLRIPGSRVTQEQHFGYLVEMLAAMGIPCRVLTYDTKENPLSRAAAIYSPDLAIAWTRVGPAVVREVEFENERRAALGLPRVSKIVFFGYSQGGVIMGQIAYRIFYRFKNRCDEFMELFGDEWRALQNDPQFIYFINALDDFLVIKNIKIQREKEFKRNPDLRRFYERAETKVSKRFDEFIRYLVDPSSEYPDVKHFEGPESPFYPKRYRNIRLCASSLTHCPLEQREKIKKFFIDYAEYRELLGIKPYFVSASGSYFGSPRANESYKLFRWFPILKLFIGSEIKQIKQTQLGTVYQMDIIENLVRLNRDDRYPVDPDNTLFIIGANDNRGDGLVDQSSAHMSNHAYMLVKAVRDAEKGGGPELIEVERERLPDLVVAPLHVMHFPEKMLWGLGGTRYGSAYMVEGNPVFPYLLAFIRDNWKAVYGDMMNCDIGIRQFMLVVSFADAKMRRSGVQRKGQSKNVKIDGRYFNRQSGTVVWTGYFRGAGQVMNLCEKEGVEGTVHLRVRLPGGARVPLDCSVYPGCNTFVRIETAGEKPAG